jgi:hypothetical protein
MTLKDLMEMERRIHPASVRARAERNENQAMLAAARADIHAADAPPASFEEVERRKAEGNTAFGAGEYAEARRAYTAGIDAYLRMQEGKEWVCFRGEEYALVSACYCNRAESLLRLGGVQNARQAVSDCDEVLGWMPRKHVPESIVIKAIGRLGRAKDVLRAPPPPQAAAAPPASATGAGAQAERGGGGGGRGRGQGRAAQRQQQRQREQEQRKQQRQEQRRQEQEVQRQEQGEREQEQFSLDPAQGVLLESGDDVEGSDARDSDECYCCLDSWAEVNRAVLVPAACKHAVCVRCAKKLRDLEMEKRPRGKRKGNTMCGFQCGLNIPDLSAYVEPE